MSNATINDPVLIAALELVTQINRCCLWPMMGDDDQAPDLDFIRRHKLAECLAAVATVVAHDAATKLAKAGRGGRTLYIIPDDRLVAAAYTLAHYQGSSDPDAIVAAPTGKNFVKGLLIVEGRKTATEENA
jgi:hypothetical protein